MAIQWPLVVFGLLAGCGGGLLVAIGISELMGIAKKARPIAAVLSVALFVLGGCASVLHLAQPANIMAAAANIFSLSGISVELIMLGVNAAIALAYIFFTHRENESAAKVTGIIGIASGLLIAFVVGNGYVMDSQASWNTIALPLSYLGSGLAMGITLFVSLATVFCDKKESARFTLFSCCAVTVQAAFFLAYDIACGFVLDAALFWGGMIAFGSVVALACAALAGKKPVLSWGAFAATTIGGICLRAAMWIAGVGYIDAFATAAARMAFGI